MLQALTTITPRTGFALVRELTSVGFVPRCAGLPSIQEGTTDTVFFWRAELVIVREVEPSTYCLYELPVGTKVYETEQGAEAAR